MPVSRRIDLALIAVVLVVGIGAGIAAVVKIEGRQHNFAVRAYDQDVRSWQEKLAGCVRGKVSYRLNREGWHSARVARLKAARDPATSKPARVFNANAADAYRLIVNGFGDLVAVDCMTAYPEPIRPNGVKPSPAIAPTIARAKAALNAGAALERRVARASAGR